MQSPDILALPARQNLRRLCGLRYAAVAGGAVAVLLADYALALVLPLASVLSLLMAVTALNTATLIRLRRPWPVTELELFAHLVMDVLVLTGLLYLMGGSTNPFIMLYLVPLALTVASLPQSYTWSIAVLAMACYGVLMFYYVPLVTDAHQHDQAVSLHIAGMWFGFVLSAALIAWFGGRMSQAVRNRDAQLAQLRESELRQERVVALGVLAAGAAHELSTPLATLAIASGELTAGEPLPATTLQLLREQIARCKAILNSLTASAGAARAQGGGQCALDEFLAATVAAWQASRPQARLVASKLSGSEPAPHIITEQTLAQAITNLLNNAADASPDWVKIDGRWTEDELSVEISDRGAGLAPEVARRAGETFTTTKSNGLGLGLFLTFATLERLGGEIHLFNRDGGGTVCRLQLPLASLKVGA